MLAIHAPKKKPLSIYDVIRPLYIVARLFGFFPFSVKIESNGKSKTCFTFIDFTIFVIQVAVYSCFTYINIVYSPVENSATSPLLALIMKFGLTLGLSKGVAFLCADLFNRYRIAEIFNMCQDVDLQVIGEFRLSHCTTFSLKHFQMQSLGSTLNYKLNKQCIYIYFGTWVVVSSVYSLITFWICRDLYSMDALVVTVVSFSLSTSVLEVTLSVYSFFLFSVRSRYSLLNDMLRCVH